MQFINLRHWNDNVTYLFLYIWISRLGQESERTPNKTVLLMRLNFLFENPHKFVFLPVNNAKIYGASKIPTFDDFYYKEPL